MPVRIAKLILLFSIIAAALYFVSLNNGEATVSVGPANSVTGSVGIIILTSFAIGVLLALLGASVYAARSYFREVGFRKREQRKFELEKVLLQLRHDSRSHPYERIKKRFETILGKNPGELPILIEYAQYLKHTKRYEELKSVTSEGKLIAQNAENYLPELYVLSAEASLGLGNLTGALDELSLLLARRRDVFAARWAAKLSYEIGRFSECTDYIRIIQESEPLSEQDQQLRANAECSILIAECTDQEERTKKLLAFILKQERSSVAYKEIARLQDAAGLKDESAQSLMRLFKLTKDPEVIRHARTLWTNSGASDKAVSAVKTWVRSTVDTIDENILARIELAKTYLLVGQDEHSRETVAELEKEPYLSAELKKDIVILKAMLAYRSKDTGASTLAFREVERIALEG